MNPRQTTTADPVGICQCGKALTLTYGFGSGNARYYCVACGYLSAYARPWFPKDAGQ